MYHLYQACIRRRRRPQARFDGTYNLVLVIAAVGMLIWLYSQYVLLILSGTYVAHGVIWYLLSMFRRRPAVEPEARPNN